MHMADALVAPAVAGTMYLCSGAAAGYSIKEINKEDISGKIPMMGVMGAFVFAAQMINFTIPGTGSSGHLCGGMLLSAMLGPYAGFLTMMGVLLIQCLLFADGGILALGCNIWNMAFYGCFAGGMVIWRMMMKKGASKRKILAASVIGCILSLQMGAFSVVAETFLSGVTELPFSVFLGFMQPIHLAIGLVEGLITASVLCFIYEVREELLWGIGETRQEKSRLSLWQTLGILAIAALLLGGVFSLAASSLPDGLEWSIQRVTGSEDLESSGKIKETAAAVQKATALFPDYTVSFSGRVGKNTVSESDKSDSETAAGTAVSGIAGGLIVAVVCIAGCLCLKTMRKQRKVRDE